MMHLQLSGSTGSNWLSLAAATVFEKIPRQRFRKEVVRIGEYIKDATGQKVDITRDVLANWVIQFQRMKANGVKIPIPSTHEGASDPDRIRGYVDDLFIDGDSLVMACTMIGEDGIKAASRNDVSLGVPELEFIDGNGVIYSQPIQHIALCPDPVVPGLGSFVPIAASRNARKEPEMDLTKIAKAFGIAEEMTNKNAEEVLLSFAKKTSEELKGMTEKLKKLQEFKKEEGTELSRKKEVDPDFVELMVDNRKMKFDSLVKGEHITPACRDALQAEFGTSERITLALSSGVDSKQFDRIMAALAKNDPVVLREQTGPQSTAELSRTGGSTGEPKVVLDAKRRAKEAAARA